MEAGFSTHIQHDMSEFLSPSRYRQRVTDAIRSLEGSSVSIELPAVSRSSRVYRASRRFQKKMERAGVTTSELLANLEHVKQDLANQRQNR
jgi:hypothetical protein